MDSLNEQHRWVITAIGDTAVYRGGTATTQAQAWLAAVAAGRAGLLSGELATVAINVDDRLEVLLDPARGPHGAVEAAAVTAELLEIYQCATAGQVLELLVSGG